ncbi:RDD family protein [Methylotenera sp. G11]|uniref:RDD family protein n=1 Tax=Methylotenera sp. G11 TaxID=1506585 RepID=UPI000ABC56FB|nr:RDD family protein [Methylotenera sp. G11]
MNNLKTNMVAPSLIKLGACLLYELLTVIAIVFVSAGLFLWVAGDATQGVKRLLLQIFLWLTIGAYFVRCWLQSGQTLAMQAWKLKLVTDDNQLLNLKFALLRYLLATFSFALCGLGFLWAIVDRQHLFLHDRILNSRIAVRV